MAKSSKDYDRDAKRWSDRAAWAQRSGEGKLSVRDAQSRADFAEKRAEEERGKGN
jgi:hypothetical protein